MSFGHYLGPNCFSRFCVANWLFLTLVANWAWSTLIFSAYPPHLCFWIAYSAALFGPVVGTPVYFLGIYSYSMLDSHFDFHPRKVWVVTRTWVIRVPVVLLAFSLKGIIYKINKVWVAPHTSALWTSPPHISDKDGDCWTLYTYMGCWPNAKLLKWVFIILFIATICAVKAVITSTFNIVAVFWITCFIPPPFHSGLSWEILFNKVNSLAYVFSKSWPPAPESSRILVLGSNPSVMYGPTPHWLMIMWVAHQHRFKPVQVLSQFLIKAQDVTPELSYFSRWNKLDEEFLC